MTLIERRLKGEDISLVQELRRFYQEELSIALRETQARGLMHLENSVFIAYVNSVSNVPFLPNIEYWESLGLNHFLSWKEDFFRIRDMEAEDLYTEERDLGAPRQCSLLPEALNLRTERRSG